MSNYNLFNKEDEVIEKANKILNQNRKENIDLTKAFVELLNDYKRLYKESKRLIVISDKNEKQLNLLNEKLKNNINVLKNTQKQLIETEKMASLGELVAGVAHEINTPIGIAVTATSKMESKTYNFSKIYQSGELAKSDLENYLCSMENGLSITFKNLERASELIQSFKQVAVDQSSEEKRKFNLCQYLNETLISLQPKLKNSSYKIHLNCGVNIELNSYAGAYSQIFTNLIVNSIIHGFKNSKRGNIYINVSRDVNNLIIKYMDDGVGINKHNLNKIFEPFFTTNRENGGSGLGMHIVYNLVTQKLNGQIECSGSDGNGIEFLITIP